MAGGDYPYASFRFLVEIEGIAAASFSKVSGLEVQIEPIIYRTGNDATTIRKIPGIPTYQNILLERGYTTSTDLWEWARAAINLPIERKTLSVVVLNDLGDPALRFNVFGAWPCRYRGPELNALENGLAIEELEICHEGFELA